METCRSSGPGNPLIPLRAPPAWPSTARCEPPHSRASGVDSAPPGIRSANESELRFVAVDTNAPFVLNFTSEDGGKTAYYWLRWVSPTGERGPWGEQAQATIAA